ncbi:hypothetical protein H112_05429 [Trichophyton rubrum D6]|uniref:Uncharacterized protein n=3 Tax=Trichophyton TaxID=5550 RepID=A0A080WK30_TRIRC|nr:uncharacterized protein TERG_11956 [Trichophyton rubrum CBS 118892]EZF61863.1 hypothetical protein H104_05428 [Trichophyton rubrum CBS 289.86]EZF72410.1 hypothetical protein H105_05456 [Trichophyton soudanense CBS 452.61]EZF83118.1 hypothetical protein H110_05436 [Trichophyton rubrum MR1448]EZF93824.1 hypothetical protein H113_05482 [Trichophyton rubrum MR1459]EZG05043.1 hypothetical protein H106_05277 [Trichophyton rubrum CBS 735.88]EZG15468.1 hypothetical protein H107_05576 [Trichophyton
MGRFSFLMLFSLLTVEAASRNHTQLGIESYPTVFKATGFKSTEHQFGLGTVPITQLSPGEIDDPWISRLIDGCPQPCSVVGSDPANWTLLYTQPSLTDCKLPLLFDLNVQSTETRHPIIRACTASSEKPILKRAASSIPVTNHSINITKNATDETQDLIPNTITPVSSSSICGAKGVIIDVLFTINPSILKPGDDTAFAVSILSSHLANRASCGEKILLAKLGSVVVGLYIGADIQITAAAKTINKFG